MYQFLQLQVNKAVLVHRPCHPDVLFLTIKGEQPFTDVFSEPTLKLVLSQNTGETWIHKNMPKLQFTVQNED